MAKSPAHCLKACVDRSDSLTDIKEASSQLTYWLTAPVAVGASNPSRERELYTEHKHPAVTGSTVVCIASRYQEPFVTRQRVGRLKRLKRSKRKVAVQTSSYLFYRTGMRHCQDGSWCNPKKKTIFVFKACETYTQWLQ